MNRYLKRRGWKYNFKVLIVYLFMAGLLSENRTVANPQLEVTGKQRQVIGQNKGGIKPGIEFTQEETKTPDLNQVLKKTAGKSLILELDSGVNLELVWVPAGEFIMGSPAEEKGRDDDESPQHKVKISRGFWLGKYEVTQRQYQHIMGNNPSHFKQSGPDAPVETVTWKNANDFCRKLQKQIATNKQQITGYKVRMPTEAEWEYACRAGSSTGYCFGDDESQLGEYAWYYYNSGKKTHPVGLKKPNAFGLYDMHGNVWEWCDDDQRDYTSKTEVDPRGIGPGRVLRGSAWGDSPRFCRSAYRDWNFQTFTILSFGFRVLLAPVD